MVKMGCEVNNTSELKARNMKRCVREICLAGKITKPQLGLQTGLTSVTTHKFVNELSEMNFVREAGVSNTSVGKKAIFYEINPNYGYLVGQDIYDGEVTTCLYDFSLHCLRERHSVIPKEYSEQVLTILCTELENITEGILTHSIHQIGITVSGEVSFEQGIITNSIGMKCWRGIPIKSLLENRLGIPVVVENDINASVIAMKWRNKLTHDFVLLDISYGIGAGILQNGKLYRGANSFAGEIGHIPVKQDGEICRCGNRGCIETITLQNNITKRVGETSIDRVISRALEGDDKVLEVLRNVVHYISWVADLVVKVYDPGILYIANSWLAHFPNFCDEISEYIFTHSTWLTRDQLAVYYIPEGRVATTYHAAGYLAFDTYLEKGTYIV